MKEEKFIELIHKKVTNELAESESQQLETWLAQDVANQIFAKQIEQTWEKSLVYQKDYEPNVEAGLSRFKASLELTQTQEKTPAKVVPMKNRRRWLQIAAAAVILMGAFFAWNTTSSELEWQNLVATNEVQKVQLDDGSEVSVNSQSKLTYPSTFAKDERLVQLSGEAFFDIAKNPQKPFLIQAGDVQVKVLGTSFNVRNFENEDFAIITVKSGTVEVSVEGKSTKVILKANDELVLNKKKAFAYNKSKDKNLNALAWWNGQLLFKNERLEKVVRAIEHTYNIEVEIMNAEVLNCFHTIPFPIDVKKESKENVLEALKLGFGFDQLKKTGANQYQLSGGECNSQK